MSGSGLVSPPTKFMKKLLAWVNATFPGPFTSSGDDLHHGRQQETYNCGIYASNTIVHAIFGDALLTPESVKYERLNWFVKCADYRVSRSSRSPVFCHFLTRLGLVKKTGHPKMARPRPVDRSRPGSVFPTLKDRS